MRSITTVSQIATLTEDEKDAVFFYDSAREQLKGTLIRVTLAVMTLGASAMLLGIVEELGLPEIFSWLGSVGIALGAIGLPLFIWPLRRELRAVRLSKRILLEKGLDITALTSEQVWIGLFSCAKEDRASTQPS